ncbi:hypothetical protein [Haloferula sp.]|uniref:hypothetical protein n=1 Tax=Haloferula sp. TaxID=2497595 RepID=UPI003C7204C8
MAAKSRKSTPRKKQAKRTEIEIVPDLTPKEVVKQLSEVEGLIAKAGELSDAIVVKSIKDFAAQASQHAIRAVQAGASALVYAWGSGKLLNAAKAKLGRGDFGAWREKNLGNEIMSERTSQRYMALAKQWQDVRALLEWSPTLRQAYVACGVLPQPPERESEAGDDAEAAKREALLSSITGIQKKLRLFSGLEGKLGAAEKKQLKLAKMEIDAFFDQILR